MVEGQERVLFVGDDFQEGVAEERLVEGQLAAYLPQGFARSIDLRDEGAQQGDFRIEREAFAGDVVGLVVDDAAVRGRAARHKGQGCGEEVVVAPAPEFVAFDPCGAEREVGVVAADGLHQRRFLEFLFRVHGYWFENRGCRTGCRTASVGMFPDGRCRGRILAGQRQDEDGTCGEFRLGFVPDLREPQGLLGSEFSDLPASRKTPDAVSMRATVPSVASRASCRSPRRSRISSGSATSVSVWRKRGGPSGFRFSSRNDEDCSRISH